MSALQAFQRWSAATSRIVFLKKRLLLLFVLALVLLFQLLHSYSPPVQVSVSDPGASWKNSYYWNRLANQFAAGAGADGLLQQNSQQPSEDQIKSAVQQAQERLESNKTVNLVTVIDPHANRNFVSLLKTYGKGIVNKPFEERCHLYFKQLFDTDPQWKLQRRTELNNIFERKIFYNKEGWVQDRLNDLSRVKEKEFNEKKQKGEKVGDKPDKFWSEADKSNFEAKFYEAYEKLQSTQYDMINDIRHLTIYSKCFLHDSDSNSYKKFLQSGPSDLTKNDGNSDNDDSKKPDLTLMNPFENVEFRMFPYLSRKLPIYQRWTGERVIGPPYMNKYFSDEVKAADGNVNIDDLNLKTYITRQEGFDFNFDIGTGESFFNSFKSKINGKGIVMSSADPFLEDTLALIRALRAVGNKLPIQIVHKGDLTSKSQVRLVQEARKNNIAFPQEEAEKLKNMANANANFDPTFPKQEVWFVNVDRCITNDYKDSFISYANKLLAYSFNSFDEMLLVDSDIVPYVNPQRFFESSQYKKSNSLFFKDRSHDETVAETDIEFFTKMLPSDLDEVMFDIPETTAKTLNNRYMKLRYKHYMESGVVALKRSQYWDGIFISVQLSFWKPVMERVWGDKELFWFSQSIAGNENYEFNENHVASIGQLTRQEFRKDLVSKELCATHPGHISSDDDSLLWINSGVLTCKRTDSFDRDFEEQSKKGFKTKEDLKHHYESALKITDAIIPPDSGLYEVQNDKGEPSRGWKTTGLCWGYFWCAYSSIGGSNLPEHQGRLIHFPESDVVWHDYVGKVYKG